MSNQLTQCIKDGQYKNDYEFNRWFIRSRNRAEYAMTYEAIRTHVGDQVQGRCVEVGPGPGTWTRLLYRANQEASFDLVDITEAMREQFFLEMRALPNVSYHVSDVMHWSFERPYDFFFSSRAVEYFDDKVGFFKKLGSLVVAGGSGVIVTKNPYHGVRKSNLPAHQGQIPMPKMKQYLEENGFTNIQFYPVVIRIPIISRFTSELSEYIFARKVVTPLQIHKINRIVESYLVKFDKPNN